MGLLKYKGYSGSVEFSAEDNCLFGKVQGLHKATILYEGNSVDELRKDFEEGVDSYLEGCKERGVQPEKPYVEQPVHDWFRKALPPGETARQRFRQTYFLK